MCVSGGKGSWERCERPDGKSGLLRHGDAGLCRKLLFLCIGADAVYLGGSKLNLRAFANNFTNEQLKEGVEFAHARGKKVYVTLNIIPHDSDLNGIESYIRELYELNVDAVLVSDPGMMTIVKNTVPELEIHLSTQANCLNYETAKFWHKMGVKRVVTA